MSGSDRGHPHFNAPNLSSPPQNGAGSRYGVMGSSPLLSNADSSSLSINYLPTKFGAGLVSRKRYGTELSVSGVPKRGGGREAFKANERRMPGPNDEDYGGVQGDWFGPNSQKQVLRWTRFKWIMFVANVLLTVYSMVALIFCLTLLVQYHLPLLILTSYHFLPLLPTSF